MKQVQYDRTQIKSYILEITRQLYNDVFIPDYIVGLARGGLPAAVKLSHYLDIPMYALNKDESNLWMAEDALNGVKILIIDDINDTGKTIEDLKKDWRSSCLPDDVKWNSIFGDNVRFATLIHNEASTQDVDYFGHTINKNENPEWCVFPWENWW
jgi:hypoxanthine phosphoribosyltransferase